MKEFDKGLFGTISSKEFKKLLKNHFSPIIREWGFTGSGFKFKKFVSDHYIACIQLFPSKWGNAIYIEIGIAVDFLPNAEGLKLDLDNIDVLRCHFRKGLSANKKTHEYSYGKNLDEAINIIKDMVSNIEKNGIPFFNLFKSFPEPLLSIKKKDLIKGNKIVKILNLNNDFVECLLLARFNFFCKSFDKMSDFIELGIKHTENLQGDFALNKIKNVQNGVESWYISKEDYNKKLEDSKNEMKKMWSEL